MSFEKTTDKILPDLLTDVSPVSGKFLKNTDYVILFPSPYYVPSCECT